MAPDELTAAQVRAYLDRHAQPDSPADQVRAYREAAAVLAAIREIDLLRPLGEASAGAAAKLLGPELMPATGQRFDGLVMLSPEVRAAAVRDLVASGRVTAALDANPAERHGLLQAQYERYLRHTARPLSEQTIDELEATLQVCVWLAGVIDGVPPVAEVETRAGYLRLLAPFEELAGDAVFRGRQQELDQLREHISVVPAAPLLRRWRRTTAGRAEPSARPAISIFGVGGAGKSSLVARFILERTRLPEDVRVPFGYLDFARASLDIRDRAGLTGELARQLDLQFPGMFSDVLAHAGRDGLPLSLLLGRLRSGLGPRLYLLVLDSFEEVQYRDEEGAYPFWEELRDVQRVSPALRVVVAGRSPVDSLRMARQAPRQIMLGELDDEAALAFLETQGIIDPGMRRALIDTFGRLPLSLKLAALLAARTPGGAASLVGPGSGLALLRDSGEVTQAQLYGRLLDSISDERVRRLAHPGLILRRINPELILDVLNEPCGLQITTIDEARGLFEGLRRESSLVSISGSDGDLVHRQDLRRVMLRMLLAEAPARVAEIHRRAVTWYSDRRGTRARVEEIYHRLHLGELIELRALRDREIRGNIQAAIDEFPPDMQLWLATAGFKVPPEAQERASRDQSHAAAAAQIEVFLSSADSDLSYAQHLWESAATDLGMSSEHRRMPRRVDEAASPLFRTGARIAMQQGDEARALELIEEGLARATRDGAAPLILGLLKDRAWLCRDWLADKQAEGLALLGEHAARHQDRTGLIQHRAQTFGPASGTAVDLAALAGLLKEADARDLWDILPVLGRPLRARSPSVQQITMRLLDLIRSDFYLFIEVADAWQSESFGHAIRSVIDDALGQAQEVPRIGKLGPLDDAKLANLCDVWPYRILYVTPPQVRRFNEQTIP